MTDPRKHWLIARIASEEYCCPHGYLRLCKARGETAKGMAENIGLSKNTIFYWYRRYKENRVHCARVQSCLMGPILEIESEGD